MKKEEIRKEFFRLKIKGHSYSQCRKILRGTHEYEVTTRTLKRWSKRLDEGNWDLRDIPTRPNTLHCRITPAIEKGIIDLRNKTGWGENKIADFVDIGHTSINKILRKNNLTQPNPNRRKRIKYIRFQREHPNTMWQMDLSDQKIDKKYCFAVLDDFSRYCLGIFALNNVTTDILTSLLDRLIKIHGKPREILTDNGAVFGLRSKHSKFDRWCRRRGILHIRSAIHSPTTTGKIERFFQTLGKEFAFCNKDAELFRMRYNHFRPHTSLHKQAPAEVYFDFKNLFRW